MFYTLVKWKMGLNKLINYTIRHHVRLIVYITKPHSIFLLYTSLHQFPPIPSFICMSLSIPLNQFVKYAPLYITSPMCFEPACNSKIYSYKISELHKYIVPISFFRSFLCVWVQLKRLPKEANAAAPTIFYVWTRCLRWANTVLFVRWIDNVALYDGDIQHFASQFQTHNWNEKQQLLFLCYLD